MKSKITTELTQSMKRGEKQRVSALRLILTELTNAEKKNGQDLGEEESLKVLKTYKKRLQKNLSQFSGGKQEELEQELSIVDEFLPKEASEEEIRSVVSEVLASTEDRSPGPLMGQVMKKLSNADGQLVKKLLKESLNNGE